MADALMVLIVLAFCGICVAYVTWCDRIIGTDAGAATDQPTDAGDGAAAPTVGAAAREVAA